jgi:hypothetical protein
MECLPVEKIAEGGDWTSELKLDGYRLQAVKAGGKVILYSRRGSNNLNSIVAPAQRDHFTVRQKVCCERIRVHGELEIRWIYFHGEGVGRLIFVREQHSDFDALYLGLTTEHFTDFHRASWV